MGEIVRTLIAGQNIKNFVSKLLSARQLRFVITVLIMLALIIVAGTTTSTFAATQPTSSMDQESAEHAAEDLVGTPISEIETKTAANKVRITRDTRVVPGAARAKAMGVSEPTYAAAAISADPGMSGKWSSVFDTPVVPVFQAVLPSGKILIWDSVGDNAAETYTDHTFTRAMVWNPADNTYKRVDVVGSNIFCAGFAHMPNGNILVAGGNADANLNGTVQTHIFNWQTETWSRGVDMAARRWYPGVTTMANGEETIVGGGPAIAEIYQANGTIRALTGLNSTTYGGRRYPFMISRPDMQLGLLGPYDVMYNVTTAGTAVVTAAGTRDGISRDYGSFATYDIGKELVTGGGNITENGVANVPTKTSVILNSNGIAKPTVTYSGSMSSGRRQFNTTVLADGSVLATGGETSAATSSLVDLNHAMTSAERWDPTTGVWTLLASASRIRQYHSTAALLPDGRVITGGGGVCGDCMTVGYLEKNVEYFTPPYLYKHDGSGQLAARPVIANAPTVVPVNTNFAVTSAQATSIRKVALIGLADVTHDVDQGQRYVPLRFTIAGTTLTVTGPPNSGVTPPGYYMLVITDANGVPSVAKIVQVAKGPNPILSPVKNVSAVRCIDVPSASLAIKTYLQSYTCNGTKAQALSRLPNDSTLRVMGNCLDVPYAHYTAGQRIWQYTCNGTNAQKWQLRTDGTIRPVASQTLCLSPQYTTQGSVIWLATCNGTTLQKWTW